MGVRPKKRKTLLQITINHQLSTINSQPVSGQSRGFAGEFEDF
jgi:hypothetical protein